MKIIILDRDGVINQDSDAYVKNAQEWLPIANSLDAIAKLCQHGFEVFVATNQSGLGRGYFNQTDLDAMHKKMADLVEQARAASLRVVTWTVNEPADVQLASSLGVDMIIGDDPAVILENL